MLKKNGIFGASVIIPIAVGLLFILALAIMDNTSDMKADATEFYEFKDLDVEKTTGSFLGTITNGTFVTVGDVINITAENESTPSDADDVLIIDINVTDENGNAAYGVPFSLKYSGTDEEFYGDITIRNDLTSNFTGTGSDIALNLSDGYTVNIRKHGTDMTFLHFDVDAAIPDIISIEPSDSISQFRGTRYATPSATINIGYSDTDTGATSTWAATNSKVKYTWDTGSEQTWDGTDFAVPASVGDHILNINATDRFDQYGNHSFTYMVSTTITDTTIDSPVGYVNTTVLSPSITILEGGSLDLVNSLFILLDAGDTLTVEDGGYLNITGPDNSSAGNQSIVSSSTGMTIVTEPGSQMYIFDTEILDAPTSTSAATMELFEGEIQASEIQGSNDVIRIMSVGVTVNNTIIMGVDSDNGIFVDIDHRWGETATMITNVTLDGTFDTPILILNNSVWKPFDVDRFYYLDEGNTTLRFTAPTADDGISDPYLIMPFYLDSRSTEAIFYAEYYNSTGSWVRVPGSFRSNMVMDEWANGVEAHLDLSGMPQGTPVNIVFNASNTKDGILYVGTPYMAGSNMDPIMIDETHYNAGNIIDWLVNEVTTPSLVFRDVTITNATSKFIDISSSGMVIFEDLETGDIDKDPDASWQLTVDHGSVDIIDATFIGDEDLSGFIMMDMDGTNDWPASLLQNSSISAVDDEIFTGIWISGVRCQIDDVEISNVSYGIRAEEGIFETVDVDIDATAYGVSFELPSTYEEDVSVDIFDLTISGNVQFGCFELLGDIDYKLDMTIMNASFSSTNTSTTYSRSDGYGSLTLDLVSSENAEIELSGTISKGPWHGVAVNDWPSDGMIVITDPGTTINDMELDGIWLDLAVDLRIENADMSQNDGWGLYGYEGATIHIMGTSENMANIRDNEEGGIMIFDDTTLTITNTTIRNNDGYGIEMQESVIAHIENSNLLSNRYGIIGNPDCELFLDRTRVDDSSSGNGIEMIDSDVTITGNSLVRSTISGNNGHGLFMDGGTLTIEYVTLEENAGDGIKLWGVDLYKVYRVTSSDNQGSGINVYIDDVSLLDTQDNYVKIWNSKFADNTGKGIAFTFDPTLNTDIKVTLEGIRSHGNRGGDLIVPIEIEVTWIVGNGIDELGSSDFSGRASANLILIVEPNDSIFIRNENITFLQDDASITVEGSGSLFMENAYIRPLNPAHRWSISATTGSRIDIKGGYLGHMSKLEIQDGTSISLDGTSIRYGEGGVNIEKTSLSITSCQFSDINGIALKLENSTGTIKGTGFHDNTRGLMIDGLDGDLVIEDATFMDNSWGIYVFQADKDSSITVKDSTFDGNDLAPIWISRANMTLQNTDVDPSSIVVIDTDHSVKLFYTLEINVKNEEGEEQTFNLELKLGESPSSMQFNNRVGTWSDMIRSYEVFKGGVDRSRESVRITISYPQSSGNEVVWGYIFDSIILDRETSIDYNGFEAPRTTVEFQDRIEADEDVGLRDGQTDISTWFTDIGTDEGNLTYSVLSLSDEIHPLLTGSVLSIDLQKDWNGDGTIQLTVTDPHGKELVVDVLVQVFPTNDVPVITDPKIISLGGEDDIPRSGDTLLAVWNWHDIDENDYEPQRKYILWYLNGTQIEEYGGKVIENTTTVPNVKAGQIWSFKAWPMDFDSINYQTYGDPVTSPLIVVKNIGPRWTSDLTYNTRYPTSDMDILVTPGTYDDPDSSLVTFNYQWEVRKGDNYIPIGAPNSPILDSRFTRKDQDIRVKAWVFDGVSGSNVRMASFHVKNSAPMIISAVVDPSILNERDEVITLSDFKTYDADGDSVKLYYNWLIGNASIAVNNEIPQLTKNVGSWSFPGRSKITVTITPFDSDNTPGIPLILIVNLIPTDTDGDGLFDDVNGDGDNDPGDDTDDDEDGFHDEWEIALGSDPLNALSTPQDTDGDGIPDGDAINSQPWMDRDDDDDGILDSDDSYPLNGALPGDLDGNGIGNDKDNDIDGDGVPNRDDYDPYNPNVSSPPAGEPQSIFEIFIFLIVLILLIALLIAVYAVYTGKVKLPSSAPPPVGDGGAEAIFEEDDDRSSGDIDLDELEDVDNMSVCSICGELIDMNIAECPNCGAAFDDEEDEFDFDDEEDED